MVGANGMVGAKGWISLTSSMLPAFSSLLPALYSTSASMEAAGAALSPASTGVQEGEQTASKGRRRFGFSVVLLFLPCAATFGLGTWQLFRRQWKVDMLDYRRSRLTEDPIALTTILRKNLEPQVVPSTSSEAADPASELEYRQVVCQGVYDHASSFFIGPRPRNISGLTQKGYILITPLHPPTQAGDSVQQPVLINRGWVPSAWREEIPRTSVKALHPPVALHQVEEKKPASWWNWSKAEQKQEETVTVVTETVRGVVRSSEQPNIFVPPNDPESGQWFFIDVPAMSRAAGLQEGAILIEAVQEDNQSLNTTTRFPIPKDPEALLHSSVMPHDHLNYALTWYTLSAVTTYMAIKRFKIEKRIRNL